MWMMCVWILCIDIVCEFMLCVDDVVCDVVNRYSVH